MIRLRKLQKLKLPLTAYRTLLCMVRTTADQSTSSLKKKKKKNGGRDGGVGDSSFDTDIKLLHFNIEK